MSDGRRVAVMILGSEVLLVAAVVVMTSFVAIPRRYRYWRLLAVLGWSLVWFDNRFTAAWHDWTGLGIVLLTLLTVFVQQRRTRGAHSGAALRALR